MAIFEKFLTKSGKHPLRTQRGLQEALAALPIAAPKAALQKAAEGFESLDSAQLSVALKINILLSLDAAVHGCQAQLWPQVEGGRSKQFAVIGARKALIEYAAAFSQQIERLIGAAQQQQDAQLSQRDDLSVLAGRSLRALAGWKRLCHLDEEIIPQEIWVRLLHVLRFAFQRAAETLAVRLYQNESTTTLQREFLRATMLDTLPLANLTWRQIEIMNVVLEHFSDHFLLRGEPGQLTPYFLDLSQSSGPQHASRTSAPAGAAFIGPGGAFPEIVQLSRRLAEDRQLPDWLALPDSKPGEVTKALAFTIRHWSRTPPERKAGRQSGSGPLQVVHGFKPTRATLEQEQRLHKSGTDVQGYQANNPVFATLSMTKVGKTASAKAAHDQVETWETVDESSTGIGAVPTVKSGGLTVGTVLGCFRTQEQQWQLAVTRRTSHDSKNRFLVGMQFIAGTPCAARIGARTHPADSPMANNNIVWRDAIALTHQNRVLFEGSEFGSGSVILLHISDMKKELYIKLVTCEESYVDCDCWTYLSATERDWNAAPVFTSAKSN